GVGSMKVRLRYFAMVREVVGARDEIRAVADGTTVEALFDAVAAEHPRLAAMKSSLVMMVNQSYVPGDHAIADGDEIAFIPPVSGGAAPRRFWIQTEPIDPRAVERLVEHPGAGAVVTFVGRVRDLARGKTVTAIDYDAYPEAAEQMLATIGDEIADRWGIDRVAIVHRMGLLGVGEASVAIAVASPHRDAAFAACRYAIERIKEIVPIWKHEHYADGAVWIGSEAAYQRETSRGAGAGG
ncbi:MAG TPA: molybdopterin converting factor subunit 1, partial [Thermomicrobiales bacterium]|nr:molybdopterin converting factor subunit 1 [Thermomicrobiales bacterium]